MLHALLVCSDDDCTDTFEAWGTLDELETLACECGCALQVIAWSDADGERGGPVELQRAA
jgi:hypothetical protein